MNSRDFKEIERLVSALHDDGLSRRDLARLEELLKDDPAAQRRYRELVDTHIALCVASSSMETEPSGKEPANRSQSAPLVLPPLRGASVLPKPTSWAWPLATVMVALVAGSLLFMPGSDPAPRGAGSVLGPSQQAGLTTLPAITHVSWEGPAFQSHVDQALPQTRVLPGAITLRLQEGKTAEGYVFCLYPGTSVDLVATFDATGENSLSIVEFTGGEQPATKKLTFHNAGEGPRPFHANPAAKNRRYGVLGHWTESNPGPLPRFFLLTGVHKLAQATLDAEWRLSELEVLLENEDAVHIGWDDSGPAPVAGESYQADGDYDDLAASLFFTPIAGMRWPDSPGQCVVSGNVDSQLAIPDDVGSGFEFDLPPGGRAIVKGFSEASYPSGMVLIDAESNEVLWSRVKPRARTAHLGAACISNHSQSLQKLRLVAVYKASAAEDAVWQASAVKTLYEQPRFRILGFDDSLGDEDYNDVRANLLIESGSASTLSSESL
ncbi:hypothetical protein [Botrimarina mediterranea]|uniref:Uncharacterized protein n=1 Tax=Botrimarina mediterranea TaxID=2528022 RepID=A0A518K2A0_9BACT|nr:hypothetical protein [Botrimarina mediterranea]QDV71933.1 hypothetical protein Spa11_01020 [Botrimarina mediterranea]QDV76474.1 hypothetical protein K2D_00520 [Planctomycetes bacterium K2D]